MPTRVLAVWILSKTSVIDRRFSNGQQTLANWQVELLGQGLPADARIGTLGMVEFIHLLRVFPDYQFHTVKAGDIPALLRSGAFDVVLMDEPNMELDKLLLPFEHGQGLLVRDPGAVLLGNLDLYGVHSRSSGAERTMSLTNSGLVQRLGPGLIRIFLPATGPVTRGLPLHVEIAFPVEPPGRDALSLLCGEKQVAFQIKDSKIEADLPAISVSQDQAFLYCKIRISDYGFGGQVPSSSISVLTRLANPG